MTNFVEITKEKWQTIDFSQFKCVKKYYLTHQDNATIWFLKSGYKERKDVKSGLYYKAGYIIEVINFKGKCNVTCQKVPFALQKIYETDY